MQWRKALISFFLIAAYAIGFSHEIIPHCHADSESSCAVAIDHLIHEDDGHSKAHLHLSHTDHLHDGILDFFICNFLESDHHDPKYTFCQLQMTPQQASFQLNQIICIHSEDFRLTIPCLSATMYSAERQLIRSLYSLHPGLDRGPPSIC